MKKLNKHIIKYEIVWEFFKDALIDANVMSNELLNLFDFKSGYFYTLLPDDANLENLYKFPIYGILPQNPTIEYWVNDHIATYSEIPHVDEEIAEFILDKVRSNKTNYCVFDDVGATTNAKTIALSTAIPPNFYSHSFFYQKEVYYFIPREGLTQEIIVKGLRVSNAFWHSLCILTDVSLNNRANKFLSLEEIKEACKKTKMVIVGAYDGESYIFWEKENSEIEHF